MKKVTLNKINRITNHGPLVVVSASYNGKTTFTPVAWNMPVQHTPPLLAVTVGKRNYLNFLIKKSSCFCLNIVPPKLKNLVMDLGSVSARDRDKAAEFKLKIQKCAKIKTFYLKEAVSAVECRLVKKISVDKVDIFIGEALLARADENFFKNNIWDASKECTLHHLGGENFCTVKKIK